MGYVKYETEGAVGILTIDRPKALNALNSEVLEDLNAALDQVDLDTVRCLINGLNPWPCVSVPIGNDRIKLLRAETTGETGETGTVIGADPKAGLIIACGKGAVRILEIQAPGGKRMKPEDYLRGHSIPIGTDLKEDRT